MVEEKKESTGYVPPFETRTLISKYLGDVAILDQGYNKDLILLKTEAEKRDSLISEVEYEYSLALNKG